MGISDKILSVLNQINLSVASGIVLTTFSLLIYVLSHNLRSSVARTFSTLLGLVMLVYGADAMVAIAVDRSSALFWLHFQWLGIAFVPAAYLHLSNALLQVTNLHSPWRRRAVYVGYGLGLLTLAIVLLSDLLVKDGVSASGGARLQAGPLFAVFAVYFVAATLIGAFNMQETRRRALTSTMRRRLTYLTAAFAAPALGAFPYLLVATVPASQAMSILLASVLFAGNVAIAFMLVVMSYSVTFFGVLAPDRVVKQGFVYYFLRGPLVGTLALMTMQLMPKTEHVLGLRRDTVLAVLVVAVVVGMQILVNLARPLIDRLVYRQDTDEIGWIRELNDRLLTTTDLRQFLENVLAGICEQMRITGGFLARRTDHQFSVEVACGRRDGSLDWVRTFAPEVWPPPTAVETGNGGRITLTQENLTRQGDFWLLPLRSQDRETVLGLLGLEATGEEPPSDDELLAIEGLAGTAETALEDRHLQQGVFDALRQIIPQIDEIQRLRGATTYGALSQMPPLRADAADPEYVRAVRDALGHYWGGPKLTSTPLLQLKVAQQALQESGGNAAKAMRALLTLAIERLRPEGERSLSAADWLLYNILDLKFVQGRKIREIASRLALSESDFYRKQRVAIEEVAKQLASMEGNRR